MAKQPLAKDRKGDYWWVDSRKLVEVEGFNRRENYGDIPKLAREIKAAGLENLEPLTCTRNGELWEVLRGHRRTRALRILEEEGNILMVRIITPMRHFNKEAMILDQITGNEGTSFTPWEQAKVLRDLRGLGWSEEDLIEKSGKSKTYVRRLLSLADAPQKLINLVRNDKVSATLAMDTIAEGEASVKELIEKGGKKDEEKNNELAHPFELHLLPSDNGVEKKNKITKSDLQKPASWKVIQKKWMPSVEQSTLKPEKAEIFQWFERLVKGQLTKEEFIEFFS